MNVIVRLWESDRPVFLIHRRCIEELPIDFFLRVCVCFSLLPACYYQRLHLESLGRKNDTKRATAEDKEIHGMVTSVINSCLGSGSIHYALILVALPPDTQQNEISSLQALCLNAALSISSRSLTRLCVGRIHLR